MNNNQNPVNSRNTVLACIDGSTYSEAVVDYAAWVSRMVASPLTLLHNIERRHAAPPDFSGNLNPGEREELLEELTRLEESRSRILLEQGKRMLDEARDRAIARQAIEVNTVQQHGSLHESLVEMEEEIRVLVLGIRGEDHENKQNQLGAQLETIIRVMHRPVLVVNNAFSSPPQRIMLAYDGSDAARQGLEMVLASPLYKGMHCHLVYVTERTEKTSALLEEAAQRLKSGGFTVTSAFLQGEVDQALRDYQEAHAIDMMVMGAFGQSRLRELLFGSVTVKMLCRSQTPLLLLR